MDEGHKAPANSPRYETRDVYAPGVVAFLVGLGVVIVLVALACWGFFGFDVNHFLEPAATPSTFATTRQVPLGPQLQVDSREDWLKFREEQEKSLETFGWENRSAGTVRVPIEEAMQLLVKKGVPVQGAQTTPPAEPKQQGPEGSKKQ